MTEEAWIAAAAPLGMLLFGSAVFAGNHRWVGAAIFAWAALGTLVFYAILYIAYSIGKSK